MSLKIKYKFLWIQELDVDNQNLLWVFGVVWVVFNWTMHPTSLQILKKLIDLNYICYTFKACIGSWPQLYKELHGLSMLQMFSFPKTKLNFFKLNDLIIINSILNLLFHKLTKIKACDTEHANAAFYILFI